MINPTCVDLILRIASKDQGFELECLKLYMLCLAKWNDSSFGSNKNFGFVEESHIEATLEEAERKYQMIKRGLEKFRDVATLKAEFDAVVFVLLEKIQQCKSKIKEDCLDFLHCPFQCEFASDELPGFMMQISRSLRHCLKGEMILDVKAKIQSLEVNLDLFKEVFEFSAKRSNSHEDLKDFKIHIQAWACRAACLSLLYWVLDVKEENMASRIDVILSDLQKKISPSTLEVTRMYLAVLKASKPSAEDSFTVGKIVLKFVEFLKDNLQVDLVEDGIQMLFIELIFLITFLMDRPEAEKLAEGKSLLAQADTVVNEVASLISSLSSREIKEGIAEERNFILHNFFGKSNAIKAEVRKIYAHLFLNPSSFNFPRINVLRLIDSLLENLKEFFFHFPKHQIMILQEELLSLKESNLKDFCILESQNKHKDVKDLWKRIVNMAFTAEIEVSSFTYMKKSLWHDILWISDVIEEVKLIKAEVKRIQDQHIYDTHALNYETCPSPLLPLQANFLGVDKFVVGIKDEVEEILDRLISGSTEIDIISIVGMAGLGKTTLAKKIYHDASVRLHFDKCAWCTVSQTFNSKRMLFNILSDVAVCDSHVSNMEEEDLAERLYRSLKGQRYLIVLDDIWDVEAWYALKMSFPDDSNGSRIIFTSRNHNVVLEAKPGSSPFPLNPLTEAESWELLEKKLFEQDGCPPDLLEIGWQIATKCKGLPLAVVLTAGLLKEKLKNLDWWKQVGESLDTLIAGEGCTDILELSYKHLPEYLKPCFLYFGSFREDEEIRVNKLILLWISEGFIQKHEIKSLEVVAGAYLMDLVARSLVIVTKRNSTGGIKACTVHDLLYDFCLEKGEAEKIYKVVHENEVSYNPIPMVATYAHYRVCIQTKCWTSFLEHGSSAPFVHSLRSFGRSSCRRYRSSEFNCITTHFKFLQVLDLKLHFSVFPVEITELVLLRFLAMSCAYGDIPSTIMRLKNLETLYLHSWQDRSFFLPLAMWEMQKLRHVHTRKATIRLDCWDGIPPLGNVDTFSCPFLSYGEEAEMFLRTIPKVRKLKCIVCHDISRKQNLKFDSLCPLGTLAVDHLNNAGVIYSNQVQILKFDFLCHLETLVVDHLDNASVQLRSCVFHFPSTLKKLTLKYFELPWSEISPIAQLPNLEVLKLYMAFSGKTWNVKDEEYLNLKYLKLEELDIEQLNASDDSFPCLEYFVVKDCPFFEEIPPRFGSISTLKMIEVDKCTPTLISSARQIQEDQVELGNEHLEVRINPNTRSVLPEPEFVFGAIPWSDEDMEATVSAANEESSSGDSYVGAHFLSQFCKCTYFLECLRNGFNALAKCITGK